MQRQLVVALGFGITVSAALAFVACSSSSGGGGSSADSGVGRMDSGSSDAGSTDECAPIESGCGQPCDKGNSLGVGQFCNNLTDCTQTQKAHLCSSLNNSPGNLPTYFCTFRCMAADAEAPEGGPVYPTSCGDNATCSCDDAGNCGCTPNSCIGK
jgi:hypothetical protein